jgi:hypothetical protein
MTDPATDIGNPAVIVRIATPVWLIAIITAAPRRI